MAYPDAGQPWEHVVAYEVDGQWFSASWLEDRDVKVYPIDDLTDGVLILISDYTVPFQEGWKVASPSEVADTAKTIIKKPLLVNWDLEDPHRLAELVCRTIRAAQIMVSRPFVPSALSGDHST